MSIDQIIKTLDEFVPFPEDDPINDNEKFLNGLMDAWKKAENKKKAIPSIFRLIERYPHANLGSPGPLVHALETTKEYEGELHISLIRKPTPLTLWMYNRLINAEKNPKIIKGHLDRLKLFEKHPLTDAATKKEAENISPILQWAPPSTYSLFNHSFFLVSNSSCVIIPSSSNCFSL